ncbi:MAG TPA: S1 RNA-binding domain-containing protein [Candidatus Limnocylindrales bacterium]|nr:S1 RNA-binding domain-containing protein [Candidatus Limnocylindrales bacterium]
MSSNKPSAKASRRPAPASASPQAGDGEDFAALFEASQGPKSAAAPARARAGDLISCKVIALGQSSVFVAVGDKAEGTIDLAEFRDPATGEIRVSVGDVVQATVLDDGSSSGSAVLTRMLGRGGHAAAELEQAFELGVPVEGLVTGETKGGYEVQVAGLRAFCPGSQIDLRRGGEDRVASAEYVGKRFPFRVTKVENEGRNIVVSRRDLLEQEAAEKAAQTWASIRVGAVLEGTVRSLRDFGAFVDLGGVDGMIHVSELAFTRVKHPGELLAVGQRVRVEVIKVGEPDKEGRRQIGLSMRALAEDPWSAVATRFAPGTSVEGTVTRVEAYGAFVEVAPGVEGLVHISKITPDRRLNHARQAVTVGQTVEVTVLSVDLAQRRLSLSMVETINRARDAEAAEERKDNERVMAEHSGSGSLGTFADLLNEARKK